MTLLIAQTPTADLPLTISLAAAAGGGDTFRNTGKERLRLKNHAIPNMLQAPPAAPTVARSVGSSSLVAGTYLVALAWCDGDGETPVGPTTSVVATLNGDNLDITAIPAVPAGMTYAAIYCSIAAGSSVLARVGQTTSPTYTIVALPTGLGVYLPTITVTVVAQQNCDQGFLHSSQVSVGSTSSDPVEVGPFKPLRFNDGAGLLHLTYQTAVGLTVAVVG